MRNQDQVGALSPVQSLLAWSVRLLAALAALTKAGTRLNAAACSVALQSREDKRGPVIVWAQCLFGGDGA